MKLRLQDWFQVSLDDRLSDSVGEANVIGARISPSFEGPKNAPHCVSHRRSVNIGFRRPIHAQ